MENGVEVKKILDKFPSQIEGFIGCIMLLGVVFPGEIFGWWWLFLWIPIALFLSLHGGYRDKHGEGSDDYNWYWKEGKIIPGTKKGQEERYGSKKGNC